MGRLSLPRLPRRRRRSRCRSKSGKPLGRYFPEVVDVLARIPPERFVLDGELIIPRRRRRCPSTRCRCGCTRPKAASASSPPKRRRSSCCSTACARGGPQPARDAARPSGARRWRRFSRAARAPGLPLSPVHPRSARWPRRWLATAGGALDGVVAKRLDGAYAAGRAGDAEGQAAPHRRLRRRRLPLRPDGRAGRLAAARPLRR